MVKAAEINQYIKDNYGGMVKAKKALGIRSSNEVKAYVVGRIANSRNLTGRQAETAERQQKRYINQAQQMREQARAEAVNKIHTQQARGYAPNLLGSKDSQTASSKEPPLIVVDDSTTQTTRRITPFESLAVTTKGGGMSQAEPYTFGQRGGEVYNIPGKTDTGLTGANIGEISTKLEIAAGIEKLRVKEEKRQAAIKGTAYELGEFQRERAKAEKEKLKPSYGKYEPLKEGEKLTLKRFGEQTLGTISLGFTAAGKGSELLIQDVKEKAQQRGLSSIPTGMSTSLNVQKTADFTQGVISGGVTKIGTDKTYAAIVAGSMVAGGVIGFIKGTATPVLSGSTLSKGAASWAAKGLKRGFYAGATIAAGGIVATAPNPSKAAGELLGSGLAIGTTYNTGKGLGTAAGAKTRATVQAARASILKRKLPGKALTTADTKAIQGVSKDLSTSVNVKPVKNIEVTAAEKVSGGTATQKASIKVNYGKIQRLSPDQIKAAKFVQLDYKSATYTTAQGTGTAQAKAIKHYTAAGQTKAGQKIITTQQFNERLLGTRGESRVLAADKTNSLTVGQANIKPSYVNPKVDISASKRIPAQTTHTAPGANVKRLDYKPVVTGKDASKELAGGFKETLKLESGRSIKRLFAWNRRDIMLNTYGTTQNPVLVVENINFIKPSVSVIAAKTTAAAPVSVSSGASAAAVTYSTVQSGDQLLKVKMAVKSAKKTETVQLQKVEEKSISKSKAETKNLQKQPSTSKISGEEKTGVVDIGQNRFKDIGKASSKAKTRADALNSFRAAIGLSSAQTSSALSAQGVLSGEASDSLTGEAITSGSATTTAEVTGLEIQGSTAISARARPVNIVTQRLNLLRSQTTTPKTAPVIPRFNFESKSGQGKGGFIAFTKIKGVYTTLGKETSKEAAYSKGRLFVDSTPSRTFGVARIGGGLRGVDLPKKGRLFSKKRGSKGTVFIEKSKKAIDSPGEFRDITLKGIFSRRSKK